MFLFFFLFFRRTKTILSFTKKLREVKQLMFVLRGEQDRRYTFEGERERKCVSSSFPLFMGKQTRGLNLMHRDSRQLGYGSGEKQRKNCASFRMSRLIWCSLLSFYVARWVGERRGCRNQMVTSVRTRRSETTKHKNLCLMDTETFFGGPSNVRCWLLDSIEVRCYARHDRRAEMLNSEKYFSTLSSSKVR